MPNTTVKTKIPIPIVEKPLTRLRLPRYTSYPPATEFADFSPDTHTQWLQVIPNDQAVSLYIHVPFCQQLCWFCGCFTSITKRYDPVQRYVEQLIKEINWVQQQTGRLKISHLHFGGGSPTMLSESDFTRVMECLRKAFEFQNNSEVAVEIDPRNVDASKISALAHNGVNRVSLGVQDFDEKVQKAIHREQPYRKLLEVVEQLLGNDINQINLDLMYGLPYQTISSAIKNAELSMTLNPSRLAVFGYAHIPKMRKHQRMLSDLPMANPDMRIEMFSAMKEVFHTYEYAAIGIDHFAKQDDELTRAMKQRRLKRNFQGYTTDQADTLLAFGLSAISSLPQGYVQNTTKLKDYKTALSNNESPVTRGLTISKQDILRRNIISELMCHYEVDIQALAQKYSVDTNFDNELSKLNRFKERNIIEMRHNKLITVTESGKAYVRAVCAVFDQYLDDNSERFSLAV